MDALEECVAYRRVKRSLFVAFGELSLAAAGILTCVPAGKVTSVEEDGPYLMGAELSTRYRYQYLLSSSDAWIASDGFSLTTLVRKLGKLPCSWSFNTFIMSMIEGLVEG